MAGSLRRFAVKLGLRPSQKLGARTSSTPLHIRPVPHYAHSVKLFQTVKSIKNVPNFTGRRHARTFLPQSNISFPSSLCSVIHVWPSPFVRSSPRHVFRQPLANIFVVVVVVEILSLCFCVWGEREGGVAGSMRHMWGYLSVFLCR